MKTFECWGGPACGIRTVDPDALILGYAGEHRDGWYEKVYERERYWLRWVARTRCTEVQA